MKPDPHVSVQAGLLLAAGRATPGAAADRHYAYSACMQASGLASGRFWQAARFLA